jgi:uncharacterized repeat protein (TIGR01451 family)
MFVLSRLSSNDDFAETPTNKSILFSLRRIVCANPIGTKNSLDLQRSCLNPLRTFSRTRRVSVTRHALLFALSLIVMLSAAGSTLSQPLAQRSTPASSAPTSAVPPRLIWLSPLPTEKGLLEEEALPQIGGIVSVGLNVELSRLFGPTTGSGFIPPDTMAAVGPNHIVELINGNFEIIDKTTGASIESLSLDAFWTTRVGLPIINNGRFDPRIVYDPASERWFAVSIDNVIDADNDGNNEASNNFFFARSDTDDPTGDWDGVTFNGDSVGTLEFHDYPTLGVDADGVYSCTQDFDGGGNESCYSIPKADLLLPVPTAANLTRFEATPAGLPAIAGSWQPAVNRGLSIGRAPLLGSTGAALRRTSIFGATAAGATLGTDVAITGDPGHSAPADARQPQDSDLGDLEDLENVAPRFVGNVVVVGGSIWAAHAVEGPAAGTNSGIRWYQINEASNTVIQTGVIEDPNVDYHEPSIAVNNSGHVVIGYTCSGPNLAASVCVSVGTTTGGVTTFQPPAIVFAGSGTYYRDFCAPTPMNPCSERNRWGDYSATVVDPTDPGTFWIFQEYTAQDAGNIDVGPGEAEGGLWGIRGVELTFNDLTGGNLAVVKTCEPMPGLFVGQTGFCEVRVTNFGPNAMLDVELTDNFVSSGTFTFPSPSTGITTSKGLCTSTPNPQVNAGSVTCSLGRIAPNESVLIHVDVTAQTPQTINDTATVTSESADSDPSNNQAHGSLVFVSVADLEIDKTATPDPVVAGTNITYTITVTNNGPSAASDVAVSDLLPATLSVISVSGSNGAMCNAGIPGSEATLCAFGVVPNGGVRTMTVVALVNPSVEAGSVITNNASVSSTTADNDNSNNFDTTSTMVIASADISVAKAGSPDPVFAGANLSYELTVSNAGPSWARNVSLADTLPAEVSFVSASVSGGGGTCSPLAGTPTVVQCSLGDIANGGSRVITIQTLVASSVPHGTVINNIASVMSTTPDPVGANNSDNESTVVNTQAEIWIDKTAHILSGNPSRAVRFTLTVYNRAGCEADDELSCGIGGPSDAQNVVVTDTLPLDPKKVRVIFVSQNCTYNETSHNVVCSVAGPLPAGESASFIIDVQTQGSVGNLTNNASVVSSTADPNLVNNADQVQIKVKGGHKNP